MVLAILQARVSSTRLPGKVLAPVLEKPMILRQIERIQQSSSIDELVVATSTDGSDDELARVVSASGVRVHRGPLDDVLARFAEVVAAIRPDTIVRLTADCPLADAAVIDDVVRAHLESGADYTSNTIHPTYADGLDVEVVDSAAFARLLTLSLGQQEREHVTLGLYTRPDEFTLNSVEQAPDRSALRWTVDVADDLEFVRTVYARLYADNPRFGQADILNLLAAEPELNRTERDLARNAGLKK